MSEREEGATNGESRQHNALLAECADALEGLLALLVDDWRCDAPVARDPWEGAGVESKTPGTGEVWSAVEKARAVLSTVQRQNDGFVAPPGQELQEH